VVLVFILVSLRQRGTFDQSMVRDRFYSVHQKQRDVSKIGARDSPNFQLQRRELLGGHRLLVRAYRRIPFSGISRTTVKNLSLTIILSIILLF